MIYNNNDDVVKELKKVLIDNGIKQQFIADGIGVSKQGFNLMLNKKQIKKINKQIAKVEKEIDFYTERNHGLVIEYNFGIA